MDYEELSLAVQKGKVKLVKELVAIENGAVGPSKDCAYENVYLKAITGTLLKRSGR